MSQCEEVKCPGAGSFNKCVKIKDCPWKPPREKYDSEAQKTAPKS